MQGAEDFFQNCALSKSVISASAQYEDQRIWCDGCGGYVRFDEMRYTRQHCFGSQATTAKPVCRVLGGKKSLRRSHRFFGSPDFQSFGSLWSGQFLFSPLQPPLSTFFLSSRAIRERTRDLDMLEFRAMRLINGTMEA